MSMKTKSNELTKAEKYQFKLSGSNAKTIASQRAAISRARLTGATPASVLKARREAFAAWRENQKDLHGKPAWLAAARWEASGSDWLHVAPVKAGEAYNCQCLARLAHNAIDWGRLRKHSCGNATAFAPRVRESDNGKSGWDKVVFRYADYLCVVSPDGRKIAVQVDKQPIEVHTLLRGRFLFRGELIILFYQQCSQITYATQLRARCKLLRRAGYDARIVRQTKEMVSAGSGESLRSGGRIECVVPDGLGGWYHVSARESVENVRQALVRRRINARNDELDKQIKQSANSIWVTVDDSLAAGNCVPGTDAFKSTLLGRLQADGEVGAVRADVILALRADQFTMRAVRAAVLRSSSKTTAL